MARAINYKPTREFSISDFGGVDLSSSPVKVAGARASYMKNFYKDEDAIKKRPGFRQALFDTVEGKVEKIVKMGEKVFVFSIKEGMGYAYEAAFIDEKLTNLTEISQFDAENVEVFYNKERLYILTGEEFLVLYHDGGSYVVENVSDNAYIPTTTAGITDNRMISDGRYTLDHVNMLTTKRKNILLVRSEGLGENTQKNYPLTEIWSEKSGGTGTLKDPFIFEFDYPILGRKKEYGSYHIAINVRTVGKIQDSIIKANETADFYLHQVSSNNEMYIFISYEGSDYTPLLYNDYMDVYIDTLREKIIVKTAGDGASFGVFPNVESDYFLTVTYVPDNEQSFVLDSKIDSDIPLKILLTKEDGSVISLAECVGNDKTPTNEVLAEDSSLTNAKICKIDRNKNIITLLDARGISTLEVTFSHKSERGGKDYESLVANCRFGTVFGTTGSSNRLFISGNPYFPNVEFWSESEDYTYFPDINYNTVGSDLTAIVGYCRLNDEVLAVFKEKNGLEPTVYYKSGKYNESYDEAGNLIYAVTTFPTYAGNVGDTMVSRSASLNFLGDPLILSDEGVRGIVLRENVNTAERYTRERSRLIDKELTADRGSLSNAVAAVFDGRYYLSIGDGRVYVADARYKTTLPGDIDGSYNYEWWVWDGIPATAFCEIDGKFYFGTGDGRICVFDNGTTDRTYISFDTGDLTFSNTDKRFTAYNSDLESYIINGAKIIVTDQNKTVDAYIYDAKEEGNGFAISKYPVKDDPVADDIKITSLTGDVKAWVELAVPILAEWRSGVMPLGTITEAKSLLSMTISASASQDGELKFGYNTKYGRDERETKGIQSLDFFDFDFTRFSFDNDFQSSYTVKCYERNFNYIQFAFRSDKGRATVYDFVATYKINKTIKGVR